MLYYVLGTFMTLVICWQAVKEKETEKRDLYPERSDSRRNKFFVLCIFSVIPLFLISAVRWNTGTDTWHTYTPEYLSRKAEEGKATQEEKEIVMICGQIIGTWNEGGPEKVKEYITYEQAFNFFSKSYNHTTFGFRAIEEVLIFLGADVQWLYVITSVVIIGFSFATIWQQSEAPILATLLFVITGNYFLSLNVISQYMAISICLFACYYAQKKKPIQFLLLVVAAASFHLSAVVFIPVYYFSKIKIKPTWCFGLIGATLILSQFGYPLLEKAISLITPIYSRYLGEDQEFEWIHFALGVAVLAVGSYYYQEGKDKPFYRLWYYMNVAGLIALCFSGHIPYMKRINYFFAAPHFLFIPLIIQCEKNNKRQKALTILITGLYIVETIVAVGMLNKNGVLPYQVFFQGNRVEMTKAFLQHIPGLW